MGRRLTIYGNWSSYDELSDGVPLTDELAMRQFTEMLRLRAQGVRFDAYLMDAFWYAPDGGYRTWRQPHWPDGPDRWLDACREHGVIPGLWFTANTQFQLDLAPAWKNSADKNDWGLCCFEGGFLSDFLAVLSYWYERGVRIFKLDFADFSAAPPAIKAAMAPDEIRARNIDAFRNGLAHFRAAHPDALFMAFNGFELKDYMERTDRPLDKVIDLRWLEVFDSVYSGDPRPSDVPTAPFWRSVDVYGDHTVRVLEHSGLPLARIDSCGFMAGPTGTCYWRGKAMWKGMLVLTLARGGDLTVLYGDLSLFSDDDARWMARVQAIFESAFEAGGARSFGGVPGEGVPYGWSVGEQLCVVVNPQPVIGVCPMPAGDWHVLFSDAGFRPSLYDDAVALGPFQVVLLGLEPLDLGVQEDCESVRRRLAPVEVVERSERRLVVTCEAGELLAIVQQRQANGRLVHKYGDKRSFALSLTIEASRGSCIQHHDKVVWSGMSWGAAEISAVGPEPVTITVTASDSDVEVLDLQIWKR